MIVIADLKCTNCKPELAGSLYVNEDGGYTCLLCARNYDKDLNLLSPEVGKDNLRKQARSVR